MTSDKTPVVKADETPGARAEQWLQVQAEQWGDWGDLEALIYRVSRNFHTDDLIERLRTAMRRAAQGAINECRAVNAPLSPTQLRSTVLRNFWQPRHSMQESSIDATMLRAVEWMQINELDAWWDRLARETHKKVFDGRFRHDTLTSEYAFNIYRSQLGIRLMKDSLLLMLENIARPKWSFGLKRLILPWEREIKPDGEELRLDVEHAARLLFVARQSNREDLISDYVPQALDLLFSSQSDSGGWPKCADQPSLLATSTVIHALATWKPTGWTEAACRAIEWIWQQQGQDGAWNELMSPGSVYLTVLVLDAIDLAEGKSQLTFVPRRAGNVPASTV